MRNFLTIILCILAGIGLARFIFRPNSSVRPQAPPPEVVELTTGRIQKVMQLKSLRVPGTVFVAKGQIVPDNDILGSIQDAISGPEKREVILLYKGTLDFGVDLMAPEFSITTDSQHKLARFQVPVPRLLDMADIDHVVLYKSGSIDEEEINAVTFKAKRRLQEEAGNPAYVNQAKSICEEELSLLAGAFGYTAQVVWVEPMSKGHAEVGSNNLQVK